MGLSYLYLTELSDEEIREFLLEKSEDIILVHQIQILANVSKSFNFLNDDEDIYTVADLKEGYI